MKMKTLRGEYLASSRQSPLNRKTALEHHDSASEDHQRRPAGCDWDHFIWHSRRSQTSSAGQNSEKSALCGRRWAIGCPLRFCGQKQGVRATGSRKRSSSGVIWPAPSPAVRNRIWQQVNQPKAALSGGCHGRTVQTKLEQALHHPLCH
jgi:hypothetical protein